MKRGSTPRGRITRRAFFTDAACAGAAMVGAGALDTTSRAEVVDPAQLERHATRSREFTAFDTDVLVIGAGSAGAEAAIAAAGAGADVIIVDKKRFGRCGDSGQHSSGYMTSSWMGLDGDTPETQLEDAVRSGEWLVDQELGLAIMQAYADDKVMLKSENYGNLHWRDPQTGKPLISRSGSKRRQWEGYKLVNHAYEALRLGCKIFDYCIITRLLADGTGAVAGATAIDFHTGEFYVFRSKATILATGGDCQLWGAGTIVALHGGGVYGLTGDGHAMAAALGVEFRDLEFRSFLTRGGPIHPTAISNFLSSGTNATIDPRDYADKDGIKFMAHVPRSELTLRRISYEVEKMLAEGRGGPHGGFFAPIEYATHLERWGFFMDDWRALQRIWEQNGLDLGRVEQHFFHTYDYGGIVTNQKAETGRPGLYAAGECAMHCGAGYGVFRMLSSCLVTGKRAGQSGAARAKAIETPAVDWSQVASEHARVVGLLLAEPPAPLRVHKIRRAIQEAAWRGSGSWRSEKKCRDALAELERIQSQDLPRLYVADKSKVCNIEWMEAIETSNMIVMAQMDTLASLTRTESRGTHLRNEHPDMDNDTWVKNVYVRWVGGRLTVDVRPVVVRTVTPPPGKFAQGGGTLAE